MTGNIDNLNLCSVNPGQGFFIKHRINRSQFQGVIMDNRQCFYVIGHDIEVVADKYYSECVFIVQGP